MHVVKVAVVSSRSPPPSCTLLSLHPNNLVIDDVKAEKVQQLEKSAKRNRGLLFL